MTSSTKRIYKLIGVNLLVFFVLANIAYWAIPTVTAISEFLKTRRADPGAAALSPAYSPADRRWLTGYHEQAKAFSTVYRSFIGWRARPLAGEAINVEGRHLQRRTVNPERTNGKTVYFFGGSTMWGVGVNDAGTIPSQFAALTGVRAENFAETGWTAPQNLVLLLQLLSEGHRPDLVVFYDGINEVIGKCGTAHAPTSHGLESHFANVLRRQVKLNSFEHHFAPVVAFAARIRGEIAGAMGSRTTARAHPFDCHTDPVKARRIAENLLRDWEFARELSQARGIKFVAALQPVAYYSRTRMDHLTSLPAFTASASLYRGQFEAIYPLLREQIARGGRFYDLAPALDRDEYLYIDPWHVSPAGNRHLARELAKLTAPLLAQ
jgi:hypothetical protein